MATRRNAAEILLRFRAENGEGLKALDTLNKRFNDTEKNAAKLNGRLAELGRRKEAENLAKVYGTIAAKTGEAEKQATALAKRLTAIGATESEIKKAADQFERFKDAQLKADELAANPEAAKGRRDTFGLRSFGANLKGLPATEIPGLGFSTDVVGKIGQLFGSLTPSAIAAGGAVGVASAALVILTQRAEQAAAAAKADLEARAAAIRLLREGSKEEIQDRINALTKQRDANAAIKADADQQLALLREGIKQQFGAVGAGIAEVNSTFETNNGELKAAKENADAAAKAVSATSTELDVLKVVTGLTAQSAEQAAAAEKALAGARGYGSRQQEAAADALELLNLGVNGTEEQVREMIASKEREIQVNKVWLAITEDDITALQKDTVLYEEAIKTRDEFTAAIERDEKGIRALTKITLDQVIANDKLAAAEKEAEQIRKESIAATKAYNDAIATIEQNNLKARADIYERYNDAVVKAADTAVAAAETALEKLEAQQDKLALSLARNEASIAEKNQFEDNKRAIERQRDEVKQLQDHTSKLKQIRADAQEEEANLIARRDFAGLFRSRRATTKAINEETARFQAERDARQVAYAEQNADEAAQREFERRQRQQKYQQDLADADAAYRTDLRNAEAARQKAIQLATQNRNNDLQAQLNKYVDELKLRRDAIVADLKLIAEGNAGKLKLEQQYYEQSMAILQSALARGVNGDNAGSKLGKVGKHESGGLGKVTPRALGGGLRRGQIAMVNEPGSTRREGFNGIPFPRSMGLFIPMQSGTVNRDTGKPSISMPITINGNNPEQIGKVVERVVGQQLDYYFG